MSHYNKQRLQSDGLSTDNRPTAEQWGFVAHQLGEQTRHGLRCAECRAPLPPEEVLADA